MNLKPITSITNGFQISLGARDIQLWGHGLWKVSRRLVLLGLCCLVVACGDTVPLSVVEQALDYQIQHPAMARQDLLGLDQLQSHISVKSVEVAQDQPWVIYGEEGQSLMAHHLEGTYTLTVAPKGQRRFVRRADPFQLTLAQRQQEETWVLAYPVPGNQDRWTTLEFLPQSADSTPELSGEDLNTSNLPESIAETRWERSPQEIPLSSGAEPFADPA